MQFLALAIFTLSAATAMALPKGGDDKPKHPAGPYVEIRAEQTRSGKPTDFDVPIGLLAKNGLPAAASLTIKSVEGAANDTVICQAYSDTNGLVKLGEVFSKRTEVGLGADYVVGSILCNFPVVIGTPGNGTHHNGTHF